MAVVSDDLDSSLSTLFSAHAKSAFRIGFSSPRRRSYRSSGESDLHSFSLSNNWLIWSIPALTKVFSSPSVSLA